MGSSSSKPAKCGRLKVASNVSELIGTGLVSYRSAYRGNVVFNSITRQRHPNPSAALLSLSLSNPHTGCTPLVRCNLDPESRCDVILKLESMVGIELDRLVPLVPLFLSHSRYALRSFATGTVLKREG